MKPANISSSRPPAAAPVPVLESVVHRLDAAAMKRPSPNRDRDAWDGFRADMRRKVSLEHSLARLNRALQHGGDAASTRGLVDQIEVLKRQLTDVNAQIADRALLAAQCHEDFGRAAAGASKAALWIRMILSWLPRSVERLGGLAREK